MEYQIQDSLFDIDAAAPRFVIRPPTDTIECNEDQNLELYCKILSVSDSPLLVGWYRNEIELKQSSKFTKINDANDYTLRINQLNAKEDSGKYIIKAENAFGCREEIVCINVKRN